MMAVRPKEAERFTVKCLDKLIEAATTDAYNESEQVSGFFTLIDDNLVVPGRQEKESRQTTASGSKTSATRKTRLKELIMTMKVTRLTTYWSPDEAATVIDFLDRLRDVLWETYGEQITRMHQEEYDQRSRNSNSCTSGFDDDIPSNLQIP